MDTIASGSSSDESDDMVGRYRTIGRTFQLTFELNNYPTNLSSRAFQVRTT